MAAAHHCEVRPRAAVIVGAGLTGLGTAIMLKQHGITDFVILERCARVGGTWRHNTYPAAECHVRSRLSSHSLAQNSNWSHAYSRSGEILDDIEAMVEQFELRPHIRFGANVTSLEYDDSTGTWTAATEDGGSFIGRAAVCANGPLSNASLPAINGLDTFEGHKIHSADWNHGYDFAGQRVAVIGTGASAVQIIPELVKTAASVKVFQRTPRWVMPKPNPPHPRLMQTACGRIPGAQTARRSALFGITTPWRAPLSGTPLSPPECSPSQGHTCD